MGWTFTHKPKHQTILQFFRDRWALSDPARVFEVLDCAVVHRKTAYLACRASRAEGTPYVFAAVCFLEYHPCDKFNFGYKDMDESCGPYAWDCPERILKLLTDLPVPNESSQKWRAACWANLAARKAAPKLAAGVVIKTAEPVEFFGGVRESFFKCVNPRRLWFVASSGMRSDIRFMLTRRAVRSATLLPPAGAP